MFMNDGDDDGDDASAKEQRAWLRTFSKSG